MMFYVPLCHIKICNWEDKKQLLLELFSKNENNMYQLDTKTDFIYQKNNNKEGLYNNEVLKILNDEIMGFKTANNFNEVKIYSSWFEKSNLSDYHGVHNHGAIGYSAVCFIKYDSKVHTPTKFHSPFGDFLYGDMMHYLPPNIEEGSLIFFPSAIAHSTLPGKVDKDRLVLSFNLDVK